jgi:uncharacterized protein (TIGR03000 family)
MYSVVLMMSLSGGVEVPDFGRRRCSCSCSGAYSSCSGCHGCHGGRRARGCHGCSGSYSCCGGAPGCSGSYRPGMAPGRAPSGEPIPRPKKTSQAEDRATVVVNLPADARLTVGGQLTTNTSGLRRFITPPLPTDGESYYYTFRAEIVRDGQTRAAVQEVAVRPGQETRVTFDFAPTEVAQAP